MRGSPGPSRRWRDVEAELGREGQVVVGVVVARLAGPEQIERRNGDGAGVQVRDVSSVVKRVL